MKKINFSLMKKSSFSFKNLFIKNIAKNEIYSKQIYRYQNFKININLNRLYGKQMMHNDHEISKSFLFLDFEDTKTISEFKEGLKFFNEKSYAKAIESYTEVLKILKAAKSENSVGYLYTLNK